VLARFFAEVRSDQLDLRDLIKAGLLVGVPLALILKQPDLGTALVLIPMLVVGAFLAGLQWQHAAVFSLAGILLVGAVFYFPLAGESSNRINGKGSFFPAPGRGRQGRRLSTFAIEDCRGFRRLLGQRIPQWQSEPAGLHPRPVFGFHHVGVG